MNILILLLESTNLSFDNLACNFFYIIHIYYFYFCLFFSLEVIENNWKYYIKKLLQYLFLTYLYNFEISILGLTLINYLVIHHILLECNI